MEPTKKLSKTQLFGYSIAGMGDNACYSFITSFLLFFLTSVAHVPNVFAGIISTAGGIWNAVFSPVIGYMSDNSSTKHGRRMPFILLGAIIMSVSILLLFMTVPAGRLIQLIYYSVLTILFWSGFSTFYIPYLALGAEMTDDYNERIKLRSYTSMFNILGALVGMAIPTYAVSLLMSQGFTKGTSWHYAGILVAGISLISILVTVKSISKNKFDHTCPKPDTGKSNSIKDLFLEYLDVMKLRVLRHLAVGSVIFLVANTLVSACRVYYATYNMNLSPAEISFMYLYAGGIGLINIPFMRMVSYRVGKQAAFVLAVSAGILAGVFFGVCGISNIVQLFVFLFFMGLANSTYWQMFPSMIYDVCEVDEFKSGKRREGAIVSIQSLAESLSSALTILLLSFILDLSGFDGRQIAQTDTALDWILYSFTFIPAFCMLLAIIIVITYPLNKKTFNILKGELARKKRGEPYSTEKLTRILK